MNNPIKEPIVGILGGMGPYATQQFIQNILDLTETKKDWDHIRLIADFNCKLPSRTRAALYNERLQELLNGLQASICHLLASGASIITVPCNTAHVFLNSFHDYPQWLDMIKVTSQEVLSQGCYNPLILCGEAVQAHRLYSEYFASEAYPDYINGECPTRYLIEAIKKNGSPSQKDWYRFNEIVDTNRLKYKTDCVILGCTELSCFRKNKLMTVTIDSNMAYAQAIVRKVKGTCKEL